MIGLFAYYTKWIRNCTELTLPLTQVREGFSIRGLTTHTKGAIKTLKNKLVKVSGLPDFKLPLTMETGASDKAFGGTLLQLGRLVSFSSRTQSNAEKKTCDF